MGHFAKNLRKNVFFAKIATVRFIRLKQFETKVRVVQFWDQFNKTFTNVFFNCNYCFQILKQ